MKQPKMTDVARNAVRIVDGSITKARSISGPELTPEKNHEAVFSPKSTETF